ncbi:tail fiber protein [Photorhabdus sp. RM96S]|uniref:tail fiber protein n=1 Tax=Photorhabdus sp. RM96S TaxID=3342822 RepID=UPI0036D98D98
MKNKNFLPNTESNILNSKIEPIGSSTNDLKTRFKEGSIPLQTDYADLIDIADIGRRAVGKAPDQTNNPNSALELDDNSGLKIKINSTGGLKADQDGLSVKLKDKSLLADPNGLAVNAGRGVKINNDQLEVDGYHGIEIVNEGVKVKASNGINVNSDGVSVKAGNGISVSGKGVEVKAKDKGSISVDSDGIAVKYWDGGGIVATDNSGLYLKLEGGNTNNGWSGVSGLSLSKNGVKVKAGNGITVDSSGVSIDPKTVLPKGMIVMFSGSSAPTGWALCDGTQGTPNLIDRFIIGGKNDEVGKTGGQGLTGSGSNKMYTVKTSNVSAGNITVNISGTALEAKHIPPHAHFVQYTWKTGGGQGHTVYSVANAGQQDIFRNPLTDAFGNQAEKHTHTSTATQGAHDHTINSLPAYYILAFIMKL